MKVEGHTVYMSAAHFNYAANTLQTPTNTTHQESLQSDTAQTKSVEINTPNLRYSDDYAITKELSASLLKTIHNQLENNKKSTELSFTHFEAEALSFSVAAYIKTDSAEIALDLQFSLSRSFVQQTRLTIGQNSPLQDPLILNLEGRAPTLSSKTFAFDIDSDGVSNQISLLKDGNAFLALDANSNNKIDNGNELFGTKSGDGFSDLRAYDDDKNGWIDANDAIFDKLRIWKKSEGKDELLALGEVGIGALYLGDITTNFSLKTLSNEQLGVMKKSGFFLFENGKAGVISQIDLAVSEASKEEIIRMGAKTKEAIKNQGLHTYKEESELGESDLAKKMQELQKELSKLEAKLQKATKEEKGAIQAQIGTVYTQMMSLISK